MAKLHFRPYIPNQTVLFPQRIDENIAADDPVRIVNAVVDNLNLDNFKLFVEILDPGFFKAKECSVR